MSAQPFEWTPGRLHRLRALAAERLPSRVIAEALGTTKNSVIGKARREDIALMHMPRAVRKSAAVYRERKNAQERAKRASKRAAKPTTTKSPLPTIDVVPTEPRVDVMGMMPAARVSVEENPGILSPEIPAMRPVRTQSGKRTIHYGAGPAHMHLDSKQCRWPTGDPKAQDFHFCTADALDGGVYCAAHAQKHIHPNWSAKTSGHAIRKG